MFLARKLRATRSDPLSSVINATFVAVICMFALHKLMKTLWQDSFLLVVTSRKQECSNLSITMFLLLWGTIMRRKVKSGIHDFFTWFIDFAQHYFVRFVLQMPHKPGGVTVQLKSIQGWVLCYLQDEECSVLNWNKAKTTTIKTNQTNNEKQRWFNLNAVYISGDYIVGQRELLILYPSDE